MDQKNQNCSNQLSQKVDRDIDEKSHEFLRQLDSFMSNYEGPLPNLRDIFRPEAIDWLLSQSAKHINDTDKTRQFIKFVALTGYKDEPKVGADGKISSSRTTPVHHAFKSYKRHIVPDLFEIYDRFDVNYVDEDGLTHFHVACALGSKDVVEKFLDHGEDPNLLVTKTGDSPLLLAMKRNSREVIELLLSRGANPNAANKDGEVALHVIYRDVGELQTLFELSNAEYRPLQINAQDKLGNTPLHMAIDCGPTWLPEFLLRKGADPNATNEEGSTPLHLVCRESWRSGDVLEKFFEINDKLNQTVQIDVRDELGRTPLQWAVANFLPDVVELLFDRGADLSNFVFPTESYILNGFQLPRDEICVKDFKMIIPFHAMEVVERLEKGGYELDRSDAVTIMRIFAKYELFEKSDETDWHDAAKKTFGLSGRSLYDTLQLPPAEAAEQLRYDEYAYMCDSDLEYQLPQGFDVICAKHLCEKATRRFFRQWAPDCLMELAHCRLPLLCCDIIMDELNNKDLFNICLAATDQSS